MRREDEQRDLGRDHRGSNSCASRRACYDRAKINIGEIMKRAWNIAHVAFVMLLIAIGFAAVTCILIAVLRVNGQLKDFWTPAGVLVNVGVAIGTFAAAGGALWISRDERRAQKNDELLRAKLSAAGAAPKLQSAIWKTGTAFVVVDSAVTNLESDGERTAEALGEHVQSAKRAFDSLQGIPSLDFDEIRSMVALPDQCAMQIEAAQGRLRAAMADLHEVQNRHSRLVEEFAPIDADDLFDDDTKVEIKSMHIVIEASFQSDLLSNARERLAEAESLFKNAVRVCEDHSSVIDDMIFDAKYRNE